MSARQHVEIERAALDAPWIVFSNSIMTDLRIWDGQVEALRGSCNILRYDQRGHGQSPLSSSAVGFEEFGRDVIDLLEENGIARCIFVGLSMGVPTGLSAYVQAPERFAAMVLVNGQAKSTDTSLGHWRERITFAQENGMDAVAAQTVARWLRPEHHNGALAARLKTIIEATPLEGFIAGANALKAYDQTVALESLHIPVQLIAGENDGALPGVMAQIAGQLPNGAFSPIENAGHVPSFERPDAFNRLLTDFVTANRSTF